MLQYQYGPVGQQSNMTLAQQPPSFEDTERKKRMHEAWKAYKGQTAKVLQVEQGQPDDNVLTNRIRPIVEKGVSFLFGQHMQIDAINDVGQPDPIQQAFLNGLWGDKDDQQTLLSQAAVNGGVYGEVFLKLVLPVGRQRYPRIIVLDSSLVRVVTAVDDCQLVLAYIIEYGKTAQSQRKQVVARVDPDGMAEVFGEEDVDDYWTVTNYTRTGPMQSWQQSGEQVIWPYSFAPIFSCQNLPSPNEFWGVADVNSDLLELNRVLNFVQSNIARIIKYHASPKTWAKGISASQINMAVNDLIVLDSDTASLQNLEMSSDLHSSLNFSAELRASMDEISRVPAVSLGRNESLPRGQISGIALTLLFQPLIELTTQKQRLYGKLIREISRAALIVMGFVPVEDYEDCHIVLHFQALLPVDDLIAAQTAVQLVALGISRQTVIEKLGYDFDAENEKAAKDPRQVPEIPAPVPVGQAQSSASITTNPSASPVMAPS